METEKQQQIKIEKRHIIYAIFLILFLTLLTLFIISFTVEDNFIQNAFNKQFGTEDNPDVYIPFLLNYILPLLIYIAVGFVLMWLWNLLLRAIKERVSPSIQNTLRVLGRMIIIPFLVIAYLNKFESFQGTLIGVAAIVGTAIGFASTKTIGNLLSGLYLILTRPFLIGDYIIIPSMSTEGIVEEININYTKIFKPDGNSAILPNSGLLDKWIYNTNTTHRRGDILAKKNQPMLYAYPQIWEISSDASHEKCVEAINQTNEEFKDRVIEPVEWFISKRDRLGRSYQITLITDDAYKIFDLTGDYLDRLESNFEKLK